MSAKKKVTNQPRKLPLRTTLVIPFVLQIMLAVSLVGYLSFRNGQKAVQSLASQLVEEISDQVAQYLDDYTSVPHQINQINLDAVDLGILNLDDFEETGQYFWRQLEVFNVGYINFGSTQGAFIGAERLDDGSFLIHEVRATDTANFYSYTTDGVGNRLAQTVEPNDPIQEEGWYAVAAEAGIPVWSDIYQWDDKPEVLSISSSYPVYDSNQTLMGVIGVDLILSQISTFLSNLDVEPTAKIFIVEPNGALVASSTSSLLYQVQGEKARRLTAIESPDQTISATMKHLRQAFPELEQISTPQELTFSLEGERQFMQAFPWQDEFGLDWLVVVTVPEAAFMEQIYANTRTTIILCLVALSVAIAMGLLTARWVTRPILQISHASDKLAQGELNQQVNRSPIIEIDTLANSFNQMANQLQESFEALSKSEATNRAIVTAIPDLMIRMRGDGTYVDVIGSAHVQESYRDRFSPGSTVQESLPPDLAQLRMHHIQAALETGELQVYEHQLTLDGQTQDEEVRIFVLGEAEVLIMVRDITSRKQNERLREENARLGTELNIAQQIQQMILPKSEELAAVKGLEISGYMAPADEVGGDYYDVLQTDGVVTLGIGDVTGHGLESGLLMLMTQTAVRTLQELREHDPVKFLDVLNRTLYRNIERMNSDRNLTLAILNYSEGRVSISGQHEETLVVRAGGEIERIDTMDLGLPIGIDDDIADFIDHATIELQPGDGVVLYTDGIPEAYNPEKEQYGMERFCEVISKNWQGTAEDIKNAIISDVQTFISEQKVFDDITLLVFKQK